MMFNAMPATDTGSSPVNASPQLSQISRNSRTRTFSSSSEESSTLSDDEEDEEKQAPKLNLRHMLLQHMKNVDTDDGATDDDTLNLNNTNNDAR